jgi:long-chain acyl-CoA synthetase
MFHSAELLANPYILAGAAQVYLPKFSASALLEAIETHGVTSTLLTPTMLIMTLEEPSFDRYDLSSLRQVIYGSSPMAAEWIEKALQRLDGVEFIQAYGLSETSPILTLLSMAEHQKAIETGVLDVLKSVGRPVPGVDLKIVDSSNTEVPTGEPGEIVVRGPNVARGYLKRPKETAEAFRGEWFYTGDIGHLDDHGLLYLLDRKKDMIITGGENVYSLEVEAILYQNPKVHECAVIGIPDERYGEALLAAIVPRPGERPAAEELIEHCRGRIGGYKIPRKYVFLDELPKSAMNKVLKHDLRRIYGEEAGGQSDLRAGKKSK